MEELTENKGYGRLSLIFGDYIARLVQRDSSPGELARQLGVSKQACSKTIRDMEVLGLIERQANPRDSRSSILSLAPRGHQLIADGHAASTEIYRHFAQRVGVERMLGLVDSLHVLCRDFAVAIPDYQPPPTGSGAGALQAARFNLLLHSLGSHCYQFLIDALADKGFSGLKPSFSQVLSLIIPDGGRIQHIASVVGVSKQAIAATATELEQLGYIVRDSDPNDRRQVILRLSPLGEQLLLEADTAVQHLEADMRQTLGDTACHELEQTLATLYFQVLDHYGAQDAQGIDIQALSQQLLQQLGVNNARELARHLMTLTRGEP
ncbi:MAG: MarR family transcriptional regulator [Bacteroidales bacterium]|nr:MarR family transcriptional regulator [Bacteroidales bacterium]